LLKAPDIENCDANACSRPVTGGKKITSNRVTAGFSSISNWFEKWYESFEKSVTGLINKTTANEINLDTQLKIASIHCFIVL